MELLGIAVGHVYFFLMFKYPQDFNGVQLLHTPQILYKYAEFFKYLTFFKIINLYFFFSWKPLRYFPNRVGGVSG